MIADARTPAEFLRRHDGFYSLTEISAACGMDETSVLTTLRKQRSFEQRTYNGKLQFRMKPARSYGGGRPATVLSAEVLSEAKQRCAGGENLRRVAADIWPETGCKSERACYQALWLRLKANSADSAESSERTQ